MVNNILNNIQQISTSKTQQNGAKMDPWGEKKTCNLWLSYDSWPEGSHVNPTKKLSQIFRVGALAGLQQSHSDAKCSGYSAHSITMGIWLQDGPPQLRGDGVNFQWTERDISLGWNQQAVRCFAVGWGEDETLKLLCLGEIAETVCARRLLTSCDWSDLRTGWRENRPETVDVRVETWKREVFRWNLP